MPFVSTEFPLWVRCGRRPSRAIDDRRSTHTAHLPRNLEQSVALSATSAPFGRGTRVAAEGPRGRTRYPGRLMTGWGKAVLTYPPTWLAAIILGATVWLILEVIDPPAFMVDRARGARRPGGGGVAVHDVGDGHARQVAVRGPARRGGRSRRDRRTARGTRALSDTQPTEQLDALLQKRASLINVLQRRLDAGELTYARYLATSQQVFSSALDNLREVSRRVREHPHDRRDLHRPPPRRNWPPTTATRSGRARTGHARPPSRAPPHPTPPHRPVAGAERVRPHGARSHHHRARRRADRQEARGCRCGNGRTRSAGRSDRRLCELIRRDLIRRTEPPEGPRR